MSRARNLKPGFFKNEALAELPFEFRILFQGLWCIADREGRLEDRPKRIKAEVFPYDDVDVATGLSELANAGFIQRYSVGESQYIQILAFKKHQNPHCKEAVSTIPAPCEHSASTEISGTSRADSLNPITDSLFSDSGTERDAPVGAKPAKGTSLPEGWTVPDEWIAAEAAKAPGIDWRKEAERFAAHHKAKGSVMKNWRQAWATWVNSPFAKAKIEAANTASVPGGGRRAL